jgi:hypothetical protein
VLLPALRRLAAICRSLVIEHALMHYLQAYSAG